MQCDLVTTSVTMYSSSFAV